MLKIINLEDTTQSVRLDTLRPTDVFRYSDSTNIYMVVSVVTEQATILDLYNKRMLRVSRTTHVIEVDCTLSVDK